MLQGNRYSIPQSCTIGSQVPRPSCVSNQPTNNTIPTKWVGEPDYTIDDNGENFCSEAFLDSNKLTRSGNTRFKIAEEVRFTLFVQNTTIADTTNTWSARNLLISRDESLRRMDCSGDWGAVEIAKETEKNTFTFTCQFEPQFHFLSLSSARKPLKANSHSILCHWMKYWVLHILLDLDCNFKLKNGKFGQQI